MTLSHAKHSISNGSGEGHALRADIAPIASQGRLRELIAMMGGDASQLRAADAALPVTLWRAREGATLLHEGSAPLAVYVLRSGCLKRIKTSEDGYEQVLSFAHPGELLGYEALHSGLQPASVVALEDATAYALSMHELQDLRERCPALDRALQMAISRQLVRAAGTAEMMAAVASDARLARFLLWVSARMEEMGQSPRRLLLRMCRRDIASLLGVAHETVSRSFTMLADAGYIRVDNREVEILDFEHLRLRARSTRTANADDRGLPHNGGPSRSTLQQGAWFPRNGAQAAAA